MVGASKKKHSHRDTEIEIIRRVKGSVTSKRPIKSPFDRPDVGAESGSPVCDSISVLKLQSDSER